MSPHLRRDAQACHGANHLRLVEGDDFRSGEVAQISVEVLSRPMKCAGQNLGAGN